MVMQSRASSRGRTLPTATCTGRFADVLRLVRQTEHRQGQVVPDGRHREAVERCQALDERDWFAGAAADQAIDDADGRRPSGSVRTADFHHGRKTRGCEGAYLKLPLPTGKRKCALANMRWEEVD